ncbi:MAG: cytochrome C oxidase subunit IV family protein [Acidobacteriaceae bacterium]|nr:cytochrome C oxidase subunit IV family protein [Acidobacteriaceae bacterium]
MTSTHVPTVRILVTIWAVLVVLTWTTVTVSHIELGPWNVVVALVIAVIKASCVGWIFMGVRFTSPLTKLFVVAGLVWLTIMILITTSDYATRRWDYHAQPWANTKDNGPATAP